MNNLRPVKGFKDLFDDDIIKFRDIIAKFIHIAKLYGCAELYTPILEHTEIFTRSLGDFSDVVTKEMYSFIDQGDCDLTLRPEFTAAIMRAIFSNKMEHRLPLKLFSYGPLFRRERPQSGRQRQFHQLNIEFLGFNQPYSDAEAINLAKDILAALKICNYTLQINSLGCAESRLNYQKILYQYFSDNQDLLSDISKIRLEKNPLRILDSKEPQDQHLVANAPKIFDYYTKSAQEYFAQVLEHLDHLKIRYTINPNIVRGLDYYSHTAFEFIADDSNLAIIAGGRYNNLSQILANKAIPSVGFAGGIERLIMLYYQETKQLRPVVIIPMTPDAQNLALQTAHLLRSQQISCLIDEGKKIGDLITRANKKHNAKYVIILGSNEIVSGKYSVKNLDLSLQSELNFNQMIDLLKSE